MPQVAGDGFAALPAFAQDKYPSRPIRIVLPFAAGSVSDVTLRIMADKLGPRLGTSIIVENQPRAGGTTAAAAAPPRPERPQAPGGLAGKRVDEDGLRAGVRRPRAECAARSSGPM